MSADPSACTATAAAHRRIKDSPGINGFTGNAAERREAMGIDWMGRYELSQAIPPAYTEWLGRQLLAWMHCRRSFPATFDTTGTPTS